MPESPSPRAGAFSFPEQAMRARFRCRFPALALPLRVLACVTGPACRVGLQIRRVVRAIADRTGPADHHRQVAFAASPSRSTRHAARQRDTRTPFALPAARAGHTPRHSTLHRGLGIRRRDERTARTQKGRTHAARDPAFHRPGFNPRPASAQRTPALPFRYSAGHASSSICAAVLGKRTVKRLPCPGADVTSTDPPWRSITAFTNGSPRPTPRLASRYVPAT